MGNMRVNTGGQTAGPSGANDLSAMLQKANNGTAEDVKAFADVVLKAVNEQSGEMGQREIAPKDMGPAGVRGRPGEYRLADKLPPSAVSGLAAIAEQFSLFD